MPASAGTPHADKRTPSLKRTVHGVLQIVQGLPGPLRVYPFDAIAPRYLALKERDRFIYWATVRFWPVAANGERQIATKPCSPTSWTLSMAGSARKPAGKLANFGTSTSLSKAR